MAFQLPIDLGNGVTVNFHTITEVTFDYVNKKTRASVLSFVGKEYAEDSGNKAINGYGYTFDGIPTGDPLDFVYSELKKRQEWSPAADVAEPVKSLVADGSLEVLK